MCSNWSHRSEETRLWVQTEKRDGNGNGDGDGEETGKGDISTASASTAKVLHDRNLRSASAAIPSECADGTLTRALGQVAGGVVAEVENGAFFESDLGHRSWDFPVRVGLWDNQWVGWLLERGRRTSWA